MNNKELDRVRKVLRGEAMRHGEVLITDFDIMKKTWKHKRFRCFLSLVQVKYSNSDPEHKIMATIVNKLEDLEYMVWVSFTAVAKDLWYTEVDGELVELTEYVKNKYPEYF